ncbi:ABC transporter permease [Streptomyces sp. NPDC091292]|uniref:ABC transporter permease n=1 Tax=Streptomyces sp. NPDC091292 TaxID=3365991 RepID=UPI00380AF448
MNFVKRAGLSLVARRGRTAILLGIFLVVCTLLLGGFMLRGATDRQEAEAQRRIGVDVTVKGDRLTADAAAKLGASPLVERYNPLLYVDSRAPGLKLVASDAPRPPDSGPADDGPGLTGIRESAMLLDFATGHASVVEGRPITARDAGRRVVMIDQRLARKNGLGVGDTIELTAAPEGKGPRGLPREGASYDIVGVFRDTRSGTAPGWQEPAQLPANQIYAPLGAVSTLVTPSSPGAGEGGPLAEAVYKLASPERAQALHADVKRLLGGDGLRFDVNDKAYRDQVEPLRKVGAFAGVLVWLIAGAGTVILGLVVTLTIRERRAELGMLLALGERKGKLIGQHTVEVAAVAVPAVALAALAGAVLGPVAGQRLPATGEVAARPGRPQVEPLPAPDMAMRAADLGKVAGIGLGISLVATVLPGIGILRLHPRSILTDSE